MAELRQKLPKGRWRHNDLFTALDTCHDWQRLPSEFGICKPEDNLSFMTAYLDAKRIIDRTEDEITKTEIEDEKRRKAEETKK